MTPAAPDSVPFAFHPVSGFRCRAEISLDALRANARTCRRLAGGSCRVMAVVKADAYGHGLGPVAAALAGEVDWFGVANVREAQTVRAAAGELVAVLLLGPVLAEEREEVVRAGFSAMVSSPEEVVAFEAEARSGGTSAKLHVEADTGMGRTGVAPERFPELVALVRTSPHCRLEGVATHFPSADEDEEFTVSQIEAFARLLGGVSLPEGCEIHAGNSAGLLGFQEKMPFATLVRPGLALYGVSPLPERQPILRPVLALKSRITLLRDLPAGSGVSYGRTFLAERDLRAATIGIGYGDGYPRSLSGAGAQVLIGGERCALLGRVTMDQIVVDVSRLGDAVATGDEAVLIGRQGDDEITAVEIAEKAGTIPWEIFTGITARVERVYGEE